MIYFVKLDIDTTENITPFVPKSMRHLLEITEKYRDTDGVNHRTLMGWLTQKQFDRLVKDCSLQTVGDVDGHGAYTEFGWMPSIEFFGGSVYDARVIPIPQRFKRSRNVRKTVEPMVVKGDTQWNRLVNTMMHRYGK